MTINPVIHKAIPEYFPTMIWSDLWAGKATEHRDKFWMWRLGEQ